MFVCVLDVPRNFSVNLATKTSVLLTWDFPETTNPYRFIVRLDFLPLLFVISQF